MSTVQKPTSFSNDIILVFVPAEENPAWTEKFQSKYPGLQVRWVDCRTPEGGFSSPNDVPDEIWEGVTIYSSFLVPSAERMSKVHFVQLSSAGCDRWLNHDLYLNPEVKFCSANGIHGPQIAEWVIGSWLSHQHQFFQYHEIQKQQQWKRLHGPPPQDSVKLRMGILGYGAIGRQCGRLGQALGMEVYAYTRSERATPESRKDDSYQVPGTGDPDGLIPAKWFHGNTVVGINDFLAQDLDLLVIGLPLTTETDQLFGREQFDILGRGKKAFVANIARGKLIHQHALIEALEDGRIRGAAIDVAEPEPLPDGHPLFSAPNLFLTPHVSGLTASYWDRALSILEENMARMEEGRPLLNVIDRTLNY